jgi:hypothetical protein
MRFKNKVSAEAWTLELRVGNLTPGVAEADASSEARNEQ